MYFQISKLQLGMHMYPETNRSKPKNETRLSLDPINYTSESYISRTGKSEPNWNLKENQPEIAPGTE